MSEGGSHLPAPSYRLRQPPASRQSRAVDTSASHIGFLRPENLIAMWHDVRSTALRSPLRLPLPPMSRSGGRRRRLLPQLRV
jgi:hypothetical protein